MSMSPVHGEVVDSGARIQAASGAGYPGPCIDSARLGVLLEDAAFAEWATETAARYRVSALDALGALAEALFRDGQFVPQVPPCPRIFWSRSEPPRARVAAEPVPAPVSHQGPPRVRRCQPRRERWVEASNGARRTEGARR